MIKWVLALGLALALGGVATAGERDVLHAPPPWWVEQAPLPPTPPVEPGAPLAILLNDSQTYFTDGGSQFYIAFAAKVLTADGLRPLGSFSEDWNPETESLTFHHFLIHRGEQVIDVLADGHFSVLQREQNLEQAEVDGRLTAALQIDGLQVGDVIDFAFTIDRRNPVLAGREGEELHLAPVGTVSRVRWRAVWPEGRLMRWRTSAGIPALAPTATNGGSQLLVDLTDVKPIPAPEGAPLRYADVAGMELTGFATWGEVSQTLEPLFTNASTLPSDSPVKAEAMKIATQTADPVKRAALALKLVQEKTRYVFIGLNLGGYVPATADQTWRRRFGDCKGKTVLLLALLHELGIKAEATLVSSSRGDGLDRHLPRLELFDHVLVRAEIGGRSYWLDGTRPEEGPLSPLTVPAYRWTLPLRPGGAVLEPMTQVPAVLPGGETIMTVDATKGLDAPMPVDVQLISRGDPAIALHRQLAGTSKADFQRNALKSGTKLFNWVELKTADWTYDPEQTVLVISLTGVGKDPSGKDKQGRPIFEVDHSGFDKPRTFIRDSSQPADAAWALPFPSYERWTTVVRLPDGGKNFTLIGPDIDATFGGFERRRESRIDHGAVVMTRSLRSLSPDIPATVAGEANERAQHFDPGVVAAALNAAPAAVAAPTTADDWLRRGYALTGEARYDEAIAAFDRAAALKSDNSAAILVGRATAYRLKKDYDRALEQYDLAARASPPMAGRMATAKAEVLFAAGRQAEALAALDTAIAASNAPADLHALKGYLLHQQDKDNLALAEIDAALKLDPANYDALLYRGDLRLKAKRYAEALPDEEALAERAPTRVGVLYALAATEENAGHDQLAYGYYDEMTRIDPFDPRGYAGRSSTGLELGRFEAAVRDADYVAAIGETDPVVLNNQCWTRAVWSHELDKALAFCDAAVAKAPTGAPALDSRSLVKLRLAQWDSAIADDDAALKTALHKAPSLFVRGVAKLRKGDAAGGQADIDAARAADPQVAARYAAYGVTP